MAAADDGSSATKWSPVSNGYGICTDEAPIVEQIFGDPTRTYTAPGVLDTGKSIYCVVAGAIVFATPSATELHFAFVAAGTGKLEVISRGYIQTSLTGGKDCYPAVAGAFVVYWANTTSLSVATVDATGRSLGSVATITPTAPWATKHQPAVAWDAVQQRLLVIAGSGQFWLLKADGTIVKTGTIALTTPETGTIGVSASGTAGHWWIAWRTATPSWYYQVATITDATTATYVSDTLIVSPTAPIYPSGADYQAAITAWYDARFSSIPEGAYVAVYRGSSGTGSGLALGDVYALSTTGVVSRTAAGFDMRQAVPACHPIVEEYDGAGTWPKARIWGYCTSSRSVRSIVSLIQAIPANSTMGTDCVPRLVGQAFRGGSPTIAPLEYNTGVSQPAVRTTKLPPRVSLWATCRKGWLLAVLAQKSAVDFDTNVYLISQVDGSTVLDGVNLPDSLQAASAGGSAHFACAVPSSLDNSLHDGGAQYPPGNPVATDYGSGTGPGVGAYSYVVLREWRDGQGNVCRSPISDPVQIVMADAHAVRIQCVDDHWQAGVRQTTICVYRTTNGGQTYYWCNSSEYSATGTDIVDTMSDSLLISQEILYTQGARGGNAGMLEWYGMPPCRCCWASGERVIAGGLESPKQVRFSNLPYPGEQVSWPENAAFWVDVTEPVTAVAALDGIYVVASETSIWIVTGQGPDAFGIGSFDTPRRVSATVGVHSWRSLVETPDGLMFQGNDGQIYLLQRGSFAVAPKSIAIRDSIGQVPPTPYTLYTSPNTYGKEPTNWIVGATYDATAREVWLVESQRRRWVYQPEFDAWRAEIAFADDALLAIGCGTTRVKKQLGEVIIAPVFLLSNTVATLSAVRQCRFSESNKYLDWGGNFRAIALHTNVVDISTGRVRRAWVRESRGNGHSYFYPAELHWWFDGNDPANAAGEVSAFTGGTLDSSRFVDIESAPSRQKCNQVRLCFVEKVPPYYENYATNILNFELEIIPAASGRGPIRNASGNGRTT
jgi:hypothetical protein